MREVTWGELWGYIKDIPNTEYIAVGEYPYVGIYRDKTSREILAKKAPNYENLGPLKDEYKYYIKD